MLVVVGRFPSTAWPGGLSHCMRVIETHQAFVVVSVQGNRVIEPMRPLFANHSHLHVEPHPIAGPFVQHEHLTIEIEQRVEAGVTMIMHSLCYHVVITKSA
jgi:hypothetical protein